jgi:hypothetical protein
MSSSVLLRLLIGLLAIGIAPAASHAQRPGKADVKASSGPDTKLRPKPMSARERAAARRAAKQKEARDAWLAKLKERGVEPWPEADADNDHEAALAESRSMVGEVIRLFPGTQLHETEHFLFVSNIPPQQIGPYILSLDRMYEWMCHLYGVPRDHKVWLGGKAPIFAFLDHDQFEAFEDRFFPEAKESLHTLSNIYGLSHLKENGEVVISCFRGENASDFGQMLVHETSHGFIHRYKTKARLPNWVDEGMADLIGAEMVPASTAVKNREYRAAQELAQRGSLGGMLEAERIEAWQYGVASSLNRFLLQQSRDSYVRFIEALKDGQKWEEALRGAYRRSPEELLTGYARWVNVANLRP